MEEEKIEETNDNPEVEETPEEETLEEKPIEEEKPPKKTEESVEELKAQRDKLYARLKKAEEKAKALESKSSDKTESLTLEAIKVGKKLEKYSDEIIDSVANVIKSDNPKDILEALENPYIKQGIEVEMKKVADAKKIPGSGSSGLSSGLDSEDVVKMEKDKFRKMMIEEAKRARSGDSGM